MITISYDFKNREAEDLAQINRLLSGLRLSDLQVENFEGYLATTTDGRSNLLALRYGLDRGTLVCTPSEDDDGFVYQVDTVALANDDVIAHENYVEIWRKAHPHRTVRTVITVEFDTAVAYTIFHHERI